MKKNVIKKLLVTGLACAALVGVASCEKAADYKVGVLQWVTHDALGAATKGFKDYIKEQTPDGKKVKFVVKNAEDDANLAKAMAEKLVKDCDLVMGNATPAITQLVASREAEGKNDLPLLFTSVTDPVIAEIVDSWESHPNQNITGTSDINPVEAQIELMFEVGARDGKLDKIGYLYNISEINSKTQCDMADRYLRANHSDVQSVTKTVSEQGQITAAAEYLVSQGCDFIYLPTDNLMAANVSTITNVTNPAKVPLVCGEEGMVKAGGTFTYSISYYELGRKTGEMASKILFEGKKANTIAVEGLTDASKMAFAYSADAVSAMGLTLSADFKSKYNIQ